MYSLVEVLAKFYKMSVISYYGIFEDLMRFISVHGRELIEDKYSFNTFGLLLYFSSS